MYKNSTTYSKVGFVAAQYIQNTCKLKKLNTTLYDCKRKFKALNPLQIIFKMSEFDLPQTQSLRCGTIDMRFDYFFLSAGKC